VLNAGDATCPMARLAALNSMCVMQASPCKLPTPLKPCPFIASAVVSHFLRALSRVLTLLTTAVAMLTAAPFCA
jgi:hypothetical protein